MPTNVAAVLPWDRDAGGPIAPELVALGDFSIAGGSFESFVAAYDTVAQSWGSADPNALGLVGATAWTTLPNGDLVVANGPIVRRWDGTTWTTLGITMNGTVHALAALASGDVVAGGAFTTADGIVVDHVTRWDGTAWQPIGAGTDGPVFALAEVGGVAVFVGGSFATAGGSAATNLALWDGIGWSAVGGGTNGVVETLAMTSLGDLVVGGAFTLAGGTGVANVAQWDGAVWSSLGGGVNGGVSLAITRATGDLIVQGAFTSAGGVGAAGLARWDGAAWSPLAGFSPLTDALALLPNGDLVGGGAGYFPDYGPSQEGVAVQRWNGTAWRPLGAGIDRPVRAFVQLPSGDLVAGGDFTQVAATAAQHVARFDGATWSPLGAGVDGTVRALCATTNDAVVAAGDFANAGGGAASRIAAWDGTAWSPLGAGVDDTVRALVVDGNGDVIAGGDFAMAGGAAASHVARWDGTAWHALGTGTDGPIHTLATLANGDVIAGGDFALAGGVAAAGLARWNGTTWSPLGSGVDGVVRSLLVLGNGDLIAGGSFTVAGGISALHVARWNGTVWSAVGAPPFTGGVGVGALAQMPDGDLVAADSNFGVWVPGQPSARLQRWDGTAWTSLGVPNGRVNALLVNPIGELAVGGTFTAVDGDVSAFFARYVSTCPGAATPTGLGCPSSGGNNTLAADGVPWVDAMFSATATGLPDPAAVVTLVGFATFAQGVLPIDSLLAEGVPGCDVLVDPVAFVSVPATAGTASLTLFLVNTPPLVGVPFHLQMVPFELDGFGGFLAVTATNALEVVAGDF